MYAFCWHNINIAGFDVFNGKQSQPWIISKKSQDVGLFAERAGGTATDASCLKKKGSDPKMTIGEGKGKFCGVRLLQSGKGAVC